MKEQARKSSLSFSSEWFEVTHEDDGKTFKTWWQNYGQSFCRHNDTKLIAPLYYWNWLRSQNIHAELRACKLKLTQIHIHVCIRALVWILMHKDTWADQFIAALTKARKDAG